MSVTRLAVPLLVLVVSGCASSRRATSPEVFTTDDLSWYDPPSWFSCNPTPPLAPAPAACLTFHVLFPPDVPGNEQVAPDILDELPADRSVVLDAARAGEFSGWITSAKAWRVIGSPHLIVSVPNSAGAAVANSDRFRAAYVRVNSISENDADVDLAMRLGDSADGGAPSTWLSFDESLCLSAGQACVRWVGVPGSQQRALVFARLVRTFPVDWDRDTLNASGQ